MLDANIKAQLKAYLERVTQPIEIVASLDEGPLRARAVADFIAGMTDRFAAREHERLTGRRLLG